MNKKVFKNYPDTTTPITAECLNELQNNIDNAKVEKTNITDAYSSSKTYAVGDYCINNNILYKCKIAIATGEEFDSTKWEQTNIAKELSSRLEFEVVETW